MYIDRLSNIARHFDGVLIDQFGVLHDGQRLYPHALDVLSSLHEAHIPVAVLTNSGKRAAANRDRIVRMGIPRHTFVDAVSSGEVAYRTINVERAFLIGKRGEDYGFDNISFVDDPKDAEVILILGTNVPETPLEVYRKLLSRVSIPAICCNPDKLMLTPQGLQPAPGAIAALYENMGGKVKWIGKPYPEIFRHALALIGNPKRALCIGDSAEHDVAGGRAAGLATALVMTGVSAGLDPAKAEPQPDYWMKELAW
jgi:HAD superfamily hydrolase (TIGR01459 family)